MARTVVTVQHTLPADRAAFMRNLKAGAGRGMREVGERTATRSQEQTPVEYGTLRASTIVEGPTIDGDDVSVEVSVGGASASYALFVHEDLDAYHAVGNAKFLENAANEMESQAVQIIANAAQRAIG